MNKPDDNTDIRYTVSDRMTDKCFRDLQGNLDILLENMEKVKNTTGKGPDRSTIFEGWVLLKLAHLYASIELLKLMSDLHQQKLKIKHGQVGKFILEDYSCKLTECQTKEEVDEELSKILLLSEGTSAYPLVETMAEIRKKEIRES